jgi:CheY-like chemotaxis protein
LSVFLAVSSPLSPIQHILLADDDEDDCVLFADVLEGLSTSPRLTTAKNGQHLMQILEERDSLLPDIIFLDVNMPLKNGIECLAEIRQDERLKMLPVIIFSTSAQKWAVDRAYELNANFFIRKPDTFMDLKNVIQKILSLNWKDPSQITKEEFLIDE